MHEMALMGDILKIIEEDALVKGINKIEKIELIVGEISNAMPDALQMAFSIFKEQNQHFFMETAMLIIHTEEAKAKCVLCETEYTPDQRISVCPQCNFPSGKIISGETFEIISYEGSNNR